jgi:hypothetical protein
MGSIDKNVMFPSKYSLDRRITIASLFRTQYTPDFLIAEYYGLRNTIFWGSKDLASGFCQTLRFSSLKMSLLVLLISYQKCQFCVIIIMVMNVRPISGAVNL